MITIKVRVLVNLALLFFAHRKEVLVIKEYWLDIRDEDKYEVSNLGNVRNKKTGRILKPQLNRSNGYQRVNMHGKHKYIHRLVADTFFEGDHGNLDVNHIDGNKQNNWLSNLEWCTRKENIQHAFINGLKYPSSVRVVRCKFCRHRYCYDICEDKPDDFFCSYGER